MTLQEERKAVFDMFGEDYVCSENNSLSIEELDESINECYNMLLYSIDRQDKEEIRYWRKMIQENKTQRRMMLAI